MMDEMQYFDNVLPTSVKCIHDRGLSEEFDRSYIDTCNTKSMTLDIFVDFA